MTDFTQQTFFNCSIRSFNANCGWNRQPSVVTINLVEDESNGDRFRSPIMNAICFFDYAGWAYYGTLSSVTERKAADGNRVFEVTLTDPRQFLDGVSLILDGYTGGVYNVPNLYNVYGYLELSGYGASLKNEAGIPWYKVQAAIESLTAQVPIKYRGIQYSLNLSGLPSLPINYRISSQNMSLLDFIDEVCEVANHDYIVELAGNVIQVVTINRNLPYNIGSIGRFIDRNVVGSISTNKSVQSEYNTINKFVVGGQVEEVFFNFQDDQSEATFGDDMITDYWGVDRHGNAIIRNPYFPSDYVVTVEGLSITDPRFLKNGIIGNLTVPRPGEPVLSRYRDFSHGYTFTLSELRAAAISRESWESFIVLNDRPDTIHTGKKVAIGITGEVLDTIAETFADRPINQLLPHQLVNLRSASSRDGTWTDREAYVQRVYEFVRDFATNYYGTKFMVRVPFTLSKMDEDGRVVTSYETTESGYIEESLHASAVQRNLLPYYTDLVTTTDNKITAFVKFNTEVSQVNEVGDIIGGGIDISSLPSDSYYIGNAVTEDSFIRWSEWRTEQIKIEVNSVFVKCEVEPDLVFLDRTTSFSPRAVITLPGPVYSTEDGPNPKFVLQQAFAEIKPDLPEAERKAQQEALYAAAGSDSLLYGGVGLALIPDMAAVPLKNTLLTYGPWYTQNGSGKVEYVKNDDLVPWNFGGFTNMNVAGTSIVSEITEARFFGEGGSVDVPGVPTVGLGRHLISGGPAVTNITVNVSSEGVTTNYRMDRWSISNGRNTNFQIEQAKKLYELKKEQRKILREKFKRQPPLLNTKNIPLNSRLKFARREQSNSSSQMICGNTIANDEGLIATAVASMPYYNVIPLLQNEEWATKGGVSLDGLFRPFSVNPDASGIAHFESASGSSPNVDDLNPFKTGHDINVVFRGSGVPEDLANETFSPGLSSDDYRPMALRGPLVIAGFGYDVAGKPVPNMEEDGSSDQFVSGYLQRSDLWKTGPLDARWDNNRKVWVASGGSNVIAKSSGTIPSASGNVPGSGTVDLYRMVDGSLSQYETKTLYNVTNVDVAPTYIMASEVEGELFYTEGGRQLRSFVGNLSISGVDITFTKFNAWVHPDGEETVNLLVEGSGCVEW